MNIVDYIVKNWDNLPKSKFDDVTVVIFNQIVNWDSGYGVHSYEGVGVDKDGNVTWCYCLCISNRRYIWRRRSGFYYSSGSSCNGGPSTEIKKNLKVFTVDGGIDLNVDPSTIDFKALDVEYTTY